MSKKTFLLMVILFVLVIFNSIFSLSLDRETVVIGGGDSELFVDYIGDEELVFRGQNNTVPTVSLIAPEDGNVSTNRTPEFSWVGSDDEGDSLTYELNVTLVPAGSCADPGRIPYARSAENYTIPTYLKCLDDDGDYYEWSVRAHDGVEYGAWSERRKIYIRAEIVISLPVDKVEFGEFLTGTNDTSDDVPPPFLLQNDGNCYLNVSVNATDLWVEASNPSDYFKYKVDNNSGEEGAFDWTPSQISWAQMPASESVSIVELNWSDEIDSVEVDLNITVPTQEVAGYKESTVYFTASLGET